MRSNKKFRTKRTKKTRINRRTKRLKKTQINRRIKKTKRKKTKRIKKTKKTKKTIQSGGSQKSVWTMTMQEVNEQIPIIEGMIVIADQNKLDLEERKDASADAKREGEWASILYTHRAMLDDRRKQLLGGDDGGTPTAGSAPKAVKGKGGSAADVATDSGV